MCLRTVLAAANDLASADPHSEAARNREGAASAPSRDGALCCLPARDARTAASLARARRDRADPPALPRPPTARASPPLFADHRVDGLLVAEEAAVGPVPGAAQTQSPFDDDFPRIGVVCLRCFTVPTIPLWTNRAEPARCGRRRVCGTSRSGPSFPGRFLAAFPR
jgi:hypothetical protein